MSPTITHIVIVALALVTIGSRAADFYVATNGKDSNPGTLLQPFATLEKARDTVRTARANGSLPKSGATVWIRGGDYFLNRPLEFNAADSGTADAPSVFRAQAGELVRVIGGQVVTGWAPVTNQAVLARMDVTARGKVVQADLRAQGITQFAPLAPGPEWSDSKPGMELFFAGKPTTLARWPNDGTAKIADFPPGAPPKISSRGMEPNSSAEGRFLYEGDRPSRWTGVQDVFLHGWWCHEWADQRLQVAKIDVAKHEILLAPKPVHKYGFVKGKSYYAFNLLSELDQPGEWYLDRGRGILYFWPPSDLSAGQPTVSTLLSLVVMNDVSHLALRGMTFEICQETAIKIKGGRNVKIAASVVRNTGSYAIDVASGKNHQVLGCDLYDLGDGGVILCGGDRANLIPAGHVVENCHIHHYSRWNPICKPAVILGRMGLSSARIPDVGSRVSHCLIDNAPHLGVWALGNDHVVEYSEFHSLSYLANDAEAFGYGFDFTYQNNVFRYNYVHDLSGLDGRGCKGVRIDDHSGGLVCYGNIFERVRPEPGRAAVVLHGGRDSVVENNLFVDCERAVAITECPLPLRDMFLATLRTVPYTQSPWKDRYPHLVKILEDEPGLPKSNQVLRNVVWGGDLLRSSLDAAPFTTVKDNLTGRDPKIQRLSNGVPTLAKDSPAWSIAFQPIPAEKIGLYRDELRASWPVTATVRPAPPMPEDPTAARKSKTPPIVAAKTKTPVRPDGVLAAGEWSEKSLPVTALAAKGAIPGKPGALRVSYDNNNLYVALTVSLANDAPPALNANWGKSDGAEISLRDLSPNLPGPVCILRGFVSGRMYVSPDAGLHPEDVVKVEKAVRFAAKVQAGAWTGEWAMPFAALEIVPRSGLKLGFNASVWRSGDQKWLFWTRGTGPAWCAGELVLE